MNLVDCYVTRVLREPYYLYEKWFVDVEYESWGNPGTTKLLFGSEQAAKLVVEGFHFLG